MTLDELLEELDTLKARYPAAGLARVVGVRDVVSCDRGEILVGELVSDETDDDFEAHDDIPVNTTEWQRVRRAALYVLNGIDCGYPLCCVLFFAGVWAPLVPIPAGRPDGFRGWLWDARTWCRCAWADRRPCDHISCPWHRVIKKSRMPCGNEQ